MKRAVIVSAVRTPVGKAPRGVLSTTRPDELAAIVLREALRRAPGFDPAEIDDVILGCAMPEAEQGLNVARIASLRAGVPVSASALTVNRFCSSGLQAIAQAAERIMLGHATAILAGGTESMSLVPMGGNKIAPNPALVNDYPDVYLTTGLVAENHARESAISREAQDAFALRSHQRAIAALDAGRFKDEIVGVSAGTRVPAYVPALVGPGSSPGKIDTDEGPRRDTSIEALSKLRSAFHVNGTVTAGNSSQMSDGAAAVLVMEEERALALGLVPLGRFIAYSTAGVAPELFGIGPVPAVQKLLRHTGVSLGDIDLVELNEAFAAQVLACTKELPIPDDKLNVNGGAIALGHPLGCTGARLTATLLHEMKRRASRYGIVTMCVGGGMGAAALFERTR
jgi:acetyl-CoA acyltransferase